MEIEIHRCIVTACTDWTRDFQGISSEMKFVAINDNIWLVSNLHIFIEFV